jgi:hypothetical protein
MSVAGVIESMLLKVLGVAVSMYKVVERLMFYLLAVAVLERTVSEAVVVVVAQGGSYLLRM